jgi:hypothetical protein
MTDYKDLLKRYIRHIIDCESIDYLDHDSDQVFTDEETNEMNEMSEGWYE